MSKFNQISNQLLIESVDESFIAYKLQSTVFDTVIEGVELSIATEGFGKKVVDGVKYIWEKFKALLRIVKDSLVKCWNYVKNIFNKRNKKETSQAATKNDTDNNNSNNKSEDGKKSNAKKEESAPAAKEIVIPAMITDESLDRYLNIIKAVINKYTDEYNEISKMIDDILSKGIENVADSDYNIKFSQFAQYKVMTKQSNGVNNPLFDGIPGAEGGGHLEFYVLKIMSNDTEGIKKLEKTIDKYKKAINEVEKMLADFEKVSLNVSKKQDDLFEKMAGNTIKFNFSQVQTNQLVLSPIKSFCNALINSANGIIKALKKENIG